MNGRLLYNAIRTPDGTIIESDHRHDFVTHRDKNGNSYSVDGGNEYAKRVYEVRDFEELSVYDNGDHQLRRKYLKWGQNYDKDMVKLKKTIWRPIMEMSTEHIEAIVEGGWANRNPFYYEVFQEELKYRKTLEDGKE